MNYKIIQDEAALKEFIAWLPELTLSEQYYFCLFSRKKYCDHPAVKYDKTQLKRGLAHKGNLFNKIQQLECKVGAYCGADDLPIPQESLALYINLNPRNLKRGFLQGIKAFAEIIDKEEDDKKNPRQEIMSVIQNTLGTKHYYVFDIDSKEKDILDKARQIVQDQYELIETRGGYHFLVPKSKLKFIYNTNWFVDLRKLSDVAGDCLSPVCGTVQGDWIPRLIK